MNDLRAEHGVAIVVAMMALLLMTAIGGVLILTSSSETIIAAHFRDAIESHDAAGAAIELGIDELTAVGDWTLATGGIVRSSWTDGAASGGRTLRDGSTIDLARVVNTANCQKATACSDGEITAVTADRPWGANNPQWVLYAYGPIDTLLPSAAIDSSYYVVVLVGAAVPPPGFTAVALRAEAFGPRGSHAVVEATAGRAGAQMAVRLLSWREVR